MTDILARYHRAAAATSEDAKSLPFEVYRSPEVLHYEAETLFRNDWVFVCHEFEIANAGDFLALTLSGEPIAVLRGKDGGLRALSNVCRHRGTPLLDEGFGNVGKLIVCPYHAWSYDHDGELRGVPLADADEVDKADHCLARFRVDSIMGLVFVHLGDRPQPLEERFRGMQDYAGVFEPSRFDEALPGSEETWAANWKLVMENGIESYHLFKVHKETLETVTPSKLAYYITGSSEWTLTGGEMIDHSSAIGKWLQGDYPRVYDHYLLLSLPPNFVGVMTWDSFGWLSVLPVDSETSLIRAGSVYESKMGGESRESSEFVKAFFAEDKIICERVQRGMRAQTGRGGKLVEMERPVVDFHQFLASRLFDHDPAPRFDNPSASVFDEAIRAG